MSTIPFVRATGTPADPSAYSLVLAEQDEETLEQANQDDCVVNRLGGARGVMAGITAGALLWAGIIWAGASLIR